jgi:hypothetical protein
VRRFDLIAKPNFFMRRGVSDIEVAGWQEIIKNIGDYVGLFESASVHLTKIKHRSMGDG